MRGSNTFKLVGAAAAALGLAVAALAAEDDGPKKKLSGPEASEPARFEARDSVKVGERTIAYSVVAGETYLRDVADQPTAAIFSVSYVKEGEDDPSERPVVFVFNGGPGSSSVWLHMGVFGPRRVVAPSDAQDDGAPPYEIEDNAATLLDAADLVFIDPVGTGFSRTFGDAKGADHWGLEQDAESVGRFIRIWLSENKRWASPKYLAGESYGTTRAAALVEELTGGWNDVALNGVILISAILDFQTARFAPGNDTPHVAYLPTMAATAWYHGKIERERWAGDIERFLAEVREFAVWSYAPALMMGAELPADQRRDIAQSVARYTGLSVDYVQRSELRVDAFRFMKELLRDQGLTVGRLDSRYTGVDPDAAGERFEDDPSGYGIDAAYTAAVNDYFTRELGVDLTRDYEILSYQVNGGWDWSTSDGAGWPAYVNVAPWLGKGMRQNADMKVLLASGYYDLATPFFGAEMSLRRNGVPTDRVVRTYYEAGHMMYVHEPSLRELADDVREFIEER